MAALFHVLAKPAGARCNLACTYCFYLDKEALYPGGRLRMSDEVLDRYLEQVVAVFQDEPMVPIAWQGGEPTLMGLDFFRRASDRLRDLLGPGQRAAQSLQTNGLLLDEEWCRFLAEEDVLVGLSIDGPREVHDAWRRDRRGGGTYDGVVRAARLLQEHDVSVNAMVTVHSANEGRAFEVYRFLRDDLGFRFLQLIPIVEAVATGVSDRSVSAEGWGRFLCAVFDEWVHHDVGHVFVMRFEAALAAWLDLEPAMCVFRRTCGDAVVLEHNGDVYSCDHFVDGEHLLGNIAEAPLAALVDSPAQRAFGTAKQDALPATCRSCDVLFACRGECPRNRIVGGLNWLCEGYRQFFHHVDPTMRELAALAREGRPPAVLMPVLEARERGDLGRNAPCPCGSGKKFKRCHGTMR